MKGCGLKTNIWTLHTLVSILAMGVVSLTVLKFMLQTSSYTTARQGNTQHDKTVQVTSQGNTSYHSVTILLDIQNVYVHSWLLKHIPKVQVTTLHSSSWQCFGGQSCGLHCHAGHHLPTEVLCSHKPVYRCNWSVYSNHRLWLWLAYSVWPPVLKDKHRDGGILLQFRFTRWL